MKLAYLGNVPQKKTYNFSIYITAFRTILKNTESIWTVQEYIFQVTELRNNIR